MVLLAGTFAILPQGRCTKYVASNGGGGILLLRTPLHKCDVIYVVSLAYKGGGGVKKTRNFAYVLCACSLIIGFIMVTTGACGGCAGGCAGSCAGNCNNCQGKSGACKVSH